MAAKRTATRFDAMKKIKLLTLVSSALVSLSQPAWAGPHGGGSGFGGGRVGGFSGGGYRAAPNTFGGARFGGRSFGGFARAPYSYYGGTGMSAVRPRGFTGSVARSTTPLVGSRTAITRPSNRVGSTAGRNRVSDPRMSRAANRGSLNTNHAFARHDANWHRDWDKHRFHFHNGHVFVFIDGFWYGFYPWDYLPYYGYDGYPYDYYGDPYDYSDYYPYSTELRETKPRPLSRVINKTTT